MAGFWLTMYVLVERRHPMKRRFLHTVGVALITFPPNSVHEHISYHTIGFGLGVLQAVVYFQLKKKEI